MLFRETGSDSVMFRTVRDEFFTIQILEIDEPFETNMLRVSEITRNDEQYRAWSKSPFSESRIVALTIDEIQLIERDIWSYVDEKLGPTTGIYSYSTDQGPIDSAPADRPTVQGTAGVIFGDLHTSERVLVFATQYQNLLSITFEPDAIEAYAADLSKTLI